MKATHLVLLALLQDRVDDLERQPHLIGDGTTAGGAFGQQEFEDQPLDFLERQPRFVESFRSLGPEGLVRILVGVAAEERVDPVEQLGEPRIPLDVVAEVATRRGA